MTHAMLRSWYGTVVLAHAVALALPMVSDPPHRGSFGWGSGDPWFIEILFSLPEVGPVLALCPIATVVASPYLFDSRSRRVAVSVVVALSFVVSVFASAVVVAGRLRSHGSVDGVSDMVECFSWGWIVWGGVCVYIVVSPWLNDQLSISRSARAASPRVF